MVVKYIANDGTIFDFRKECEEYEEKKRRKENEEYSRSFFINRVLKEGSVYIWDRDFNPTRNLEEASYVKVNDILGCRIAKEFFCEDGLSSPWDQNYPADNYDEGAGIYAFEESEGFWFDLNAAYEDISSAIDFFKEFDGHVIGGGNNVG